MKKTLNVALFLFIISTQLFAQSTDKEQGLKDGAADAATDVSGVLWIGIGCCTGGFSYLYPEIWDLAVPQTKVIGKSPEYVEAYNASYRAEKKSTIQTNSCIGGGIYWGASIIYIVLVAAAAS